MGEPISTKRGDWSDRAKYVLTNKARSMEELYERQERDGTSLGIVGPKQIHDLLIVPDEPEWKPKFLEALRQARLWDDRTMTREPPRKVPFKFKYKFQCDDERCNRNHEMMIEDWEVGALYWKLVDQGSSPDEAAAKVREKFLTELCGPNNDTHFFVGTILAHPKNWVVIGVFYPKRKSNTQQQGRKMPLFPDDEHE